MINPKLIGQMDQLLSVIADIPIPILRQYYKDSLKAGFSKRQSLYIAVEMTKAMLFSNPNSPEADE